MSAQFNLPLALAERDFGINAVAERNQTFLETVRGAARMICRNLGSVTADDVRKWAEENGYTPLVSDKWRRCEKYVER